MNIDLLDIVVVRYAIYYTWFDDGDESGIAIKQRWYGDGYEGDGWTLAGRPGTECMRGASDPV
jgi:hypothetical protein